MGYGQNWRIFWRFASDSWVQNKYVDAGLAFADALAENDGCFTRTEELMGKINAAIAWEDEILRRGMPTGCPPCLKDVFPTEGLAAVLENQPLKDRDCINYHREYLETVQGWWDQV